MTHQEGLTRVNTHLESILAQGAEIIGNKTKIILHFILHSIPRYFLDL